MFMPEPADVSPLTRVTLGMKSISSATTPAWKMTHKAKGWIVAASHNTLN